MQISETTFTVDHNGGLKIPSAILKQMGLSKGDHIRVAYLTKDGTTNNYRELLLSADTLDSLSNEQVFNVPEKLLQMVEIPADSDVQIICLKGCLMICQDTLLNTEELLEIKDRLKFAVEMTSDIPLSKTQEQLEEAMRTIQEGVNASDIY